MNKTTKILILVAIFFGVGICLSYGWYSLILLMLIFVQEIRILSLESIVKEWDDDDDDDEDDEPDEPDDPPLMREYTPKEFEDALK